MMPLLEFNISHVHFNVEKSDKCTGIKVFHISQRSTLHYFTLLENSSLVIPGGFKEFKKSRNLIFSIKFNATV